MNLPSKIKIVKSHEGLPPVGTVMEISNISDKYYSYFPDVIDSKCEYVDRDMLSLALEAKYAEPVVEQWQAWDKKDNYFSFDEFLNVVFVGEIREGLRNKDFNKGMIFPTREIATQARDRILETLKQFHKEHKND